MADPELNSSSKPSSLCRPLSLTLFLFSLLSLTAPLAGDPSNQAVPPSGSDRKDKSVNPWGQPHTPGGVEQAEIVPGDNSLSGEGYPYNIHPKDTNFKQYDYLGKYMGLKVKEIPNMSTYVKDNKFNRLLHVVIFYSKSKCYKCNQKEYVLEEVIDRFSKQVDFYRYNCDLEHEEDWDETERTPECDDNYPHTLPRINFKEPLEGTYYPYNPIPFEKPIETQDTENPNDLAETIEKYMPVYAKIIKNMEDSNTFVEKYGELNRAFYFTSSEEIPTYFKALSAKYKDKMEFALVKPDAYDVLEYFNITSKPRWMVTKLKDQVGFEKRVYHGDLTFEDLDRYLDLFAKKEAVDRTNQGGLGKEDLRDIISKKGKTNVKVDREFDFDTFKNNFREKDQVHIVHVIDPLTMNYPNLVIFQKFYGNLATVIQLNANTLQKKRILKKKLPQSHRPYIIVYPPGNHSEKMQGARVLGASHTIEDLLGALDDFLPREVQPIQSVQLQPFILKSLHERKVAVVLFHDQPHISLGLRRLASLSPFKERFNFYQMRDPPASLLQELEISKLSKLMAFIPDPALLLEPTADVPVEKLPFERKFIFDKLKKYLEEVWEEYGRFLADVPEFTTEYDFKTQCVQSKRDLCLIFILDRAREELNESFLDRMNDMITLHAYTNGVMVPGYFDIGCFPELADTFRFDPKKLVPLMVVYNKKEKTFIRAENRLNAFDGQELLRKIGLGHMKEHFRPLSEVRLGINRCVNSTEEFPIDL